MTPAAPQTAKYPADATPAGPAPILESIANLGRALAKPPQAWEGVPKPAAPPAVTTTPVEPLSAASLRAFYLLSQQAPETCLAEFRQLRGRLFRMQESAAAAGYNLKTVLVTSPSPGDGKTFVALNLALMMAVAPGCRVLVADVNLHRPAFHERLYLPQSPGVREALAGTDLRGFLRRVPFMDLSVATLGLAQPSDMEPLDYSRLRQWLESLRKDFDWIILDGPELEAGPDAEMLAHIVDGTLLVLSAGRSTFDQIDGGISRLDRQKLVGAVLNGRV